MFLTGLRDFIAQYLMTDEADRLNICALF